MSGPFARIIAQVVVTGASIFSRAFVAAYSQALHNAQKGTQEGAKAMARTSKMTTDEALQVLNLSKTECKEQLIKKQYDKYFEANNPSKGGSFYLQSKVFRARESLDELLELRRREAAEREEKQSNQQQQRSEQ